MVAGLAMRKQDGEIIITIAPKLSEVLSISGPEDEAVNALVLELLPRVSKALIPTGIDKLETEKLREDLNHVLHWALHIGQSCWKLTQGEPDITDEERETAFHDLYYRPFVMMDAGDEFHGLVRSWSMFKTPAYAGKSALGNLDENAIFTRIRLQPTKSIEQTPIAQAVMERILCQARLYLTFLEALASTGRMHKSRVRDCVVNLCALSLSMSGDALRLLWPI